MTDLEITKLCAEAMGVTPSLVHADGQIKYWPLTEDAQAMALVKKFGVAVYRGDSGWWWADIINLVMRVSNADLNRAICLCVANMQAGK